MELLGSKYIVERRLGGGGMAEVFLGRTVGAEGFSRTVAIKRVIAGHADDPQFVKMFVAEAQISARLQHPNIVSVLDFDRDEAGRPFLVMEHVEGTSLQELVDTGALPTAVIVYVIAEVLRGLGHAHQLPVQLDGVRGVVHRDVSPHNVLLSWEGAVKVSDFGVAKIRAASEVTASEMLKGKPAYMSPEQVNGDALDGRSDLFAVGIMLWQLLCGRTLFAGNTTQETLARLLFAPIPSPRDLRDDIPDELVAITMKLLARDRADRYPNAAAAIAALLACECYPRSGTNLLTAVLQERCVGAPPPDESVERTQIPTVAAPRSVERLPGPLDRQPTIDSAEPGLAITSRPRERRTALLAGVGAALGIGGAVALHAVTREPRSSPAVAAPAPLDASIASDAAVTLAAELPDAGTASEPVMPVDATLAEVPKPVDAGVRIARVSRDGGIPPAPRDASTERVAGDPPADPTATADLFDKILAAQRAGKPYAIVVPQPSAFDPYAFHARARSLATAALGPVRLDATRWKGFDANGRLDTHSSEASYMFAATQPKAEHCVLTFQVRGGRATLMLGSSDGTCKPGYERAPRCTAAQLYARARDRGMPEDGPPVIAFAAGRSSWQMSRGDWNDTFANDCQ